MGRQSRSSPGADETDYPDDANLDMQAISKKGTGSGGKFNLFRRGKSPGRNKKQRQLQQKQQGRRAAIERNPNDDVGSEAPRKPYRSSRLPTPSQVPAHRLFYSTLGDDNGSEDSFESRMTRDTPISGSEATSTEASGTTLGTVLRFRGFSTSLQSLFLDEALVCASMGCFGLILSNRTEHLLQLRNDRRGVRWGRSHSRRALPSKIIAYFFLLTIVCISITFIIWGFGSGSSSNQLAEGWYEGYDTNSYNEDGENDDMNNNNENDEQEDQQEENNNNYDDAMYEADDGRYDDGNNANMYGDDAAVVDDAYGNNNQNDANYQYQNGGYYYQQGNGGNRRLQVPNNKFKRPHPFHGVFKLRDVHEGLWEPALDLYHREWEQFESHTRRLDNKNNVNYGDDYAATTTQESNSRDLASDLRLAFVIAFLIVLGFLGRRRRMRTRYYLVRARAQEDHLFYASAGAGVKRIAFQDSREDQYEGACSHTFCGCYPVDPAMDGNVIMDDVKVDEDGVSQRKRSPQHHDCVSQAFACLMACCCGVLCRCWCQCMPVCALAQEAREIRLLVPTRYQRVDFITHQPFIEYQQNINELRRRLAEASRTKVGLLLHFRALSRLSRFLFLWFLSVFVLIAGTLMFNPRASFSWPDLVLLTATFVQSFLVIFCVQWIFHKSDLSLDAVIKFYSAGFLIAVPAAFFFEGLLVNITLIFVYSLYAVGEKISENFTIWIVDNWKWLWIVGELFNAYVVAAVTEELCKYYTFRCVEHPDLIFLTGLGKAAQDERSMAGGIVKYPFSPDQVEETNKREAYDDDDDRSVSSRASHRSTGSRKNKKRSGQSTASPQPLNAGIDSQTPDEEFKEDERDIRTHRQKAMAVTTGMICVAVGLACAENFLYVFLLGGSEANAGDVQSGGVIEEWIVLLFRSLFPIHALAAAMQSINVIRKFIECDTDYRKRIGVGRVVFPAVIMHGSFDAVLLGINIYIETSWDAYLDANEGNFDVNNPPYNPILVNLVAWISLVFVMFVGLAWYYRENRQQRQRLIALEQKEREAAGLLPGYQSPDAGGYKVKELELV